MRFSGQPGRAQPPSRRSSAPLRLGGAALAAADGEHLPAAFEHDDGGGLAQHPAGLRGRQRRAALKVGAAGGSVVGQHVGVDVHHDLPAGRIPGPPVDVGGDPGQRGQRRAAPGGRALPGEGDFGVLVAAVGDLRVDPVPGAGGAGGGALGLGTVPAGGPLGERVDRGDQRGALLGGQPGAEHQHAVVVPPGGELPPAGQGLLAGIVGAAPLPHRPLGLRRGGRGGELD
jgi:hypothetical protein